jgi:hypothetical protein
MTKNVDSAEQRLYDITVCAACIHFNFKDLFEGYCKRIQRDVDHNNKCECWETKSISIQSEVNNLAEVLCCRAPY